MPTRWGNARAALPRNIERNAERALGPPMT